MTITELKTKIDGSKTYILVAFGFIALALNIMGYISDEILKTILEGLGLGTIFTLRSALKKLE